jgi:hypothetical protein
MADIGYKASVESLPEIKEMLCNLDNDLLCGIYSHALQAFDFSKGTAP